VVSSGGSGASGSTDRVEERWLRAGMVPAEWPSGNRGKTEPIASTPRISPGLSVPSARIRDLQVADTGRISGRSYTSRVAGTIMIVEDEPAVARGVQVALEREGYAVSVQPTGEDAIANFADTAPDLVVLDVRLPGIDGFEVLRQLRRETRAPVLFLTARADEVDKVVGLEMGADDYLVKPFSVRELVTRIKALLRRAYGELADTQTGRTLRRGDLVIDLERRRVTRDGERIGLTTTEFDLLRHLASRPGRVYTRAQLLELVRDYDDALEQDERTINVHISHIRDKVEPDPAQPRYIRTVRGVGYAFAED
jgi:DNA-binding response OmpR family regulator